MESCAPSSKNLIVVASEFHKKVYLLSMNNSNLGKDFHKMFTKALIISVWQTWLTKMAASNLPTTWISVVLT